MFTQCTQTTQTSASEWPGLLNSQWNRILFLFHKRVFHSRIEGILNAAAGHETNSLPAGDHQYQTLSAQADRICSEFAERWRLDEDLLKARIPGMTKLAALAVPQPKKNYAQRVCLLVIATPLSLFLFGVMIGLVSVGFHLVGGH